MPSVRWLSTEESKVTGDLDRLRTNMRTWEKGTPTHNMDLVQSLDKAEYSVLFKDLAEVCLLENDQLPQGLSSSKGSSLLLNALLAHNVYTTLFRNPFFFLEDGLGGLTEASPRLGPDRLLENLYQRTQQCE